MNQLCYWKLLHVPSSRGLMCQAVNCEDPLGVDAPGFMLGLGLAKAILALQYLEADTMLMMIHVDHFQLYMSKHPLPIHLCVGCYCHQQRKNLWLCALWDICSVRYDLRCDDLGSRMDTCGCIRPKSVSRHICGH